MPTYSYQEVEVDPFELDKYPLESSIFDDYVKMNRYMKWNIVKELVGDSLSDKQLEVVTLTVYGLRQCDIAVILNISQQAVSDRLKRGIFNIKEKIMKKYLKIIEKNLVKEGYSRGYY